MPRYNGTGPLDSGLGVGWGLGPYGAGVGMAYGRRDGGRGRGLDWKDFGNIILFLPPLKKKQ